MKTIILTLSFFVLVNSFSQSTITLEECYSNADKNYPLLKQNELFEKQNEYDLKEIKNKRLPKFDLSIQATYQSDVVALPIDLPPTLGEINPPNKDQYKATLTVNQLIYGGGAINASTKIKDADLLVKKAETKVNMYQLKQKINQLYFSIILLDEKTSLLKAKEDLLKTKLKEVQSAIKNGVVIPNSDKVLEIELIKVKSQFSEIETTKNSLIKTLSSVTGTEISLDTKFENLDITLENENEISRPELKLFKLNKDKIELAEKMFAKQNLPKVFAFGTAGYGNPGLNMLDNSFQPFYILGLKASWNVYDFGLAKNKRKSLAINKEIIDTKEEVFKLNTQIEIDKNTSEIEKLENYLIADKEIIQLRKEVLKSYDAQLRNGVITTSTYSTELTNLFQSENLLKTHKIQILLAKANLLITKGN